MADRFEVWTVATFNVVALGLVLLLVGHRAGALADALSGLGTVPGLLVFGYLWGLTLYATRWALRGASLAGATNTLLQRGAVAGAGIGASFLLGVVLVGAAATLLAGNPQLVTFVLIGAIGSIAASLVGAPLGVVFVLVDLLCYRLARSIVGK